MEKIASMEDHLGIPLQACIASNWDEHRKPNTGMWKHFVTKMNQGVVVDCKLSLYVGDEAGRPSGWKVGVTKDFSDSDRVFADVIGLPFETPDLFFLTDECDKFYVSRSPQSAVN